MVQKMSKTEAPPPTPQSFYFCLRSHSARVRRSFTTSLSLTDVEMFESEGASKERRGEEADSCRGVQVSGTGAPPPAAVAVYVLKEKGT